MELFILLVFFNLIFIFVRLINLVHRNILPEKELKSKILVSVLVPMRNEESNAVECIQRILSSNYSNIEVIVFDDASSDKTLENLNTIKSNKLKIISGIDKPKEWIGKNWACWNLANVAKGEYILFIDADVRIHKNAISSALAEILSSKISLLSVFPNQKMNTFWEKLNVPTFFLFLVSFLPIFLVKKSHNYLFSASNGQFMFWKKSDYFLVGGHKRVFNCVVEDVELARIAKFNGLKVNIYFSPDLVYCRMYNGFKDSFIGISKIYRGIVNTNNFIYLIFTLFIFSIFLLPYILSFIYPDLFLLIFLDFLSIFLLYIKFGFKGIEFFLIPLHKIVLIFMMLYSLYLYKRKYILWKGRNVL